MFICGLDTLDKNHDFLSNSLLGSTDPPPLLSPHLPRYGGIVGFKKL